MKMGKATIKFGTSGWRAVMCDEFTFENVRLVTQAIADYLAAHGQGHKPRGVVVGYDNRFMGERFAKVAASVLAANDIPAKLTDRSVPTPVLAFDILENGWDGALNFTASHNPPHYNGLKFSPSWGGPALPETTSEIERRANKLIESGSYKDCDFDQAFGSGLISSHNPRPAYLERLRGLVDLELIGSAGLKFALDPLYGTSVGYLDTLLEETGCDVRVIHENPDPTFGGRPPEPSEEYIPELIALVRDDDSYALGLSTDGDADRFGIVDRGGKFIEPNYFLALLFDYLVRERGIKGGVGRSVATSHLIDAVAADLGRKVFETPVGFKFIGELISRDELVMGGEESAGLSIRGHVPEKDGILACLLAAEMVAKRGKSLTEQLGELYARVGMHLTRRENFRLTAAQEAALPERLAAPPKAVGGVAVVEVVTVDGTKLLLEDSSWLLVRKSGTEPVVRLYGEAAGEKALENVLEAGRRWLLG
jgi:alpha-D-glucose phosphate-specific phosphoglucomutase